MRVDRLTLKDFTVFGEADFEFSPGLNVLIGANGTGKSHVLKVLYSVLRAMGAARTDAETGRSVLARDLRVWDKVFPVFRPEPASRADLGQGAYHSLTRRGAKDLHLEATGDFGEVMLDVKAGAVPLEGWEVVPPGGHTVFVPASEVLSIYPGFIAAYERRELSFDETFRDLCVDLSANPLRSVSPAALAELVAKLDEAVGGKTVLRGERFYVSVSEDWLLEAPMLAEGLRKLASIAHLIRNGSLAEKSALFWDEPETNLNPKLVTVVAKLLLDLAGAGVQVFIATHDYLLTNELSVAAEYGTPEAQAAKPRFFCLGRSGREPVTVQWADAVADLVSNPILEEFAAHYDRQQKLFAQAGAPKE
jgi:predicted ATPase